MLWSDFRKCNAVLVKEHFFVSVFRHGIPSGSSFYCKAAVKRRPSFLTVASFLDIEVHASQKNTGYGFL